MEKTLHKKLGKLLANTGDMALKRRAKKIILEANPQMGDRILEVGCGDGFYLHILSTLNKKFKLAGVDYDKNALKSAQFNLMGRKIQLKQGNLMEKIDFKNAAFDTVIMSEVAEHLPNDVTGLKEVYRVLKKGGKLVLTVPNHNYPLFWDPVNWVSERLLKKHVKKGFWAGIWNQHVRLYKQSQIKKVVEKAGFSVVKVESLTWWCLPFNHNLMHFMALKLYGGQLSDTDKRALNKFEPTKTKKPLLINFAFKAANFLDRLNDVYQPKGRGVGVLVVAKKI